MAFRSPLSKARAGGSAHEGSDHWMMQRITAIALIFLTASFVLFVVQLAQAGGDSVAAQALLSDPCNALLTIFFLIASFYHGALGIQVVIEDYVSCLKSRMISIIIVKLACVAFAGIGIFAVLSVYFKG